MGFTRKLFNRKHTSSGRLWGHNTIYGADDGKPEMPYMTRMWIGRLRFHLFHRGDKDPDCHDHPWAFWTFPLRSYVEEVVDPISETIHWANPKTMKFESIKRVYFERRLVVVRAFRLHYRPATYAHRVLGPWNGEALQPGQMNPPLGYGKIPTFVWRKGETRKWGFIRERAGLWCWTPWKKYVYEGGKSAPCEPEESLN